MNEKLSNFFEGKINGFAPEDDPSGRTAMLISNMKNQFKAAEKEGKVPGDERFRIAAKTYSALIDPGSEKVQNMHSDMQVYIGEGMPIDSLIINMRYSKDELYEYYDWLYVGNPDYLAEQKETVDKSIANHFGSDEKYEQEQIIHVFEREYTRAVAETLAMFFLSFTPFDELIDAIQVGVSLAEGKPGDALLNGIGFIPMIGSIKYIDDIAGLIKGGKKVEVLLNDGSEIYDTIKNITKNIRNLPDGAKIFNESGEAIAYISRKADNVAEIIKYGDNIRIYKPSIKHRPGGFGNLDPYYSDLKAGQAALDGAYTAADKKQLFNYYEGNIVKWQPGEKNEWHCYIIKNTSKEVPTDVLRQMLDDGVITKPQYNKFTKNK